jgi:hypothetical protein
VKRETIKNCRLPKCALRGAYGRNRAIKGELKFIMRNSALTILNRKTAARIQYSFKRKNFMPRTRHKI